MVLVVTRLDEECTFTGPNPWMRSFLSEYSIASYADGTTGGWNVVVEKQCLCTAGEQGTGGKALVLEEEATPVGQAGRVAVEWSCTLAAG